MKIPFLKSLSSGKPALPNPSDALDYNKLPVLTAEQLVTFTGQQNRLRNIKRIVRIDDETYDVLYQETLHRFFELVQLMPASQAHHHAVPAGLMIHTLEVIEHALTLRQKYKLPQFAAQEIQEAERHVWTFAIFIAALLHDVGKRITMCRFILESGKELEPFADISKFTGATYRLAFVDTRYYALHEKMGLAFVAYLLGPIGLNFLLPRLHIMEEVSAYIHEDKTNQGIIGKILREADKHSTGGSLAHTSSRRFKGANLLNIGERLMTQLRQLLAANHFLINRGNGNVYTTPEGYTYIISKTLADELRNTMREQGETDIPGDNLRIFDILQEFGFAETNASGQIIHYIQRTYQGKTDNFSVLKFRTSRLFQVMPPGFPGQVVELAGKPEKQEPSPFPSAYAARSLPEAAHEQNFQPEAVRQTQNRTGAEHESQLYAELQTESVRTITGVQEDATAAPKSNLPPVPVDDKQAAEFGHDDPLAGQSGLGNDEFSVIDDVPVPKEATNAGQKNASAGTGEDTPKNPSSAKPDDIPSAFMEWCREKIRSKKVVINESSGMIQKVMNGNEPVVAVVTPRAFMEFSQEVLGLPHSEASQKQNIQQIQNAIHKQKLNIPSKRGQVHTYRILRSESGGFNIPIKLSHYLFSLDKFAGGDHEIKEILDKTIINTNLEKM